MNDLVQSAASKTFEPLSLQTAPIITFGYVMQVIFSLIIVLGLIYLASKYLLPRLQVTPKGKFMEVLERIGLEPHVTAYLLKARGKEYLVVVSNKDIVKLDSFEEGEKK
ncbi:MAG: hypothetical protein ABIJ26_02815 [Candidatus Margulisiibacteriota bacterium]|nr:hypothetical protein [Candidatus Margulisiibacteriota bacterium]